MHKNRVAVLRGGPSNEHDVSVKTGKSVLTALSDTLRFEPVDVFITRNGEWLVNGFPRRPEMVLASVDVAFNALHGSYGEDGTVQRMLKQAGVPHTGSGAYASSVAMNKILTKEYLFDSGIRTAPHMRVTSHSAPTLDRVIDRLIDLLGEQCVVKPVSGGSSLDTHIVTGAAGLRTALTELLNVYDEVFVEKRIRGREATCGVVDRFRNTLLYSLPAIEIVIPQSGVFFDFDAKYSGNTEEVCPGRFTQLEKENLERYAKTVHATLGLQQYSRTDFIIADEIPGKQCEGIYFLEVNTLPGLTHTSLFPKALEAVGCTYQDFISHLITDALHHAR